MTAPTQTQSPPSQVQAAEVAAILAGSLSAIDVFGPLAGALIPAGLVGLLARLRRRALRAVLQIVDRYPQMPMEGIGEAQRQILRMNALRRAAYIPVSMNRMADSMQRDMAAGYTQNDAASRAVIAENRYWAQHTQASHQRILAANEIDALRYRYGDILGWYARRDGKVTPECKAANGKNFSALHPPAIGWPGIVHVNCRCKAGKPHRKGAMLV